MNDNFCFFLLLEKKQAYGTSEAVKCWLEKFSMDSILAKMLINRIGSYHAGNHAW